MQDINDIIDNALKEHYRETMGRKRVPSDYLLMFTEGGESNAVAFAVKDSIIKEFEKYTEGDIYGDANTRDYILFQIPLKDWEVIKGK